MVDQKLADSFAAKLGFSEYAATRNISNNRIAMTADGVGTKLLVAEHFRKFDTVGIDLVAMCANDLICSGSVPDYFMDYYAVGNLEIEKSTDILSGIQKGCKLAGAELVGGETAQLKPMFKKNDWFDLAGFMVGHQIKKFHLESIRPGDYLVGIPSNGVHSNGFTTLRTKTTEWDPDWLTPTRIYVNEIINNIEHIKACAHITGGGIHGNLPRILKEKQYTLDLTLNSWWEKLRYNLSMTTEEMYNIFNCGWGMILVTDSPNSLDIEDSKILGEVNRKN